MSKSIKYKLLNFNFKNSYINFLKQKAFDNIKIKSLFNEKISNWKYINCSLFNEFNFCNLNARIKEKDFLEVNDLIRDIKSENLIVLLNGKVVFIRGKQNWFCSLVDAQELYSKVIKTHLSTSFNLNLNFFASLNTAFFNDGVFVYLNKNVLNSHLHILNISKTLDDKIGFCPRFLIVLEKNSNFELEETNINLGNKKYLSNLICELFLGENSNVNHTRFIKEGVLGLHLSNIFIQQNSNSNYVLNQLSLAGNLIYNNINVDLLGKKSFCNVNGLDLVSNSQCVNNTISINHYVENCISNQIFKGIYLKKSSGFFNGRIFVDVKADKTKALQINRNLLLSNDAKICTNPQLEINANDVKCTHGAIVSNLNNSELFFLRSRGISKNNAKKILAESFILDLLNSYKNRKLKNFLKKEVKAWMKNNLGGSNE